MSHSNDIFFYFSPLQNCQIDGPVERFARGYEDYLQCPLQPLMDNLESQTYEIFEKDPIKYTQYQAAIVQAIININLKRETKLDKMYVSFIVDL